jgi:hypothetical protein
MGLLDSFVQDGPAQAPTGLLGQGFADPRSAAIMALAGSMVRGDFGGGLIGANDAFQKSANANLQRADVAQQIGLRNLQLQQQLRQWQLTQPILERISQRLGGAQPAGAPSNATPAIPATPGGALGSGTFGIPTGGQPASGTAPVANAAPGGAGMFGVPEDQAMLAIAGEGLPGLAKASLEYNKPTDFQKLLSASGVDPSSPLGRQLIQSNIAKQNYVAPVNARPGSIIRDPMDPSKVLAFNPHVPEGSTPQFDANGNVVAYQPLGNAEQALAMPERARKTGANQVTPSIVYGPDGTPRFSTVAQDVNRASGLPPTAPAFGGGLSVPQPDGSPDAASTPYQRTVSDVASIQKEIARVNGSLAPASTKQMQLGILNQELAKATAAANPPAAQPQPAAEVTPVLKPGAAQGATLSQDELSKKAASLMADNGQTNTVISRLQNIKMLAPGAITGAETGRRDFMNGLLSLAGIPAASDYKTASDLVEKNAAQITSALRMGQGGAGTDALQTLISAANPNRHMTPDAINEAVDQLVASQKMIQSKAKLLQPLYLSRDPVAYGQAELTFDQNADPRVWQLQDMNPKQQAAYVKTLPASVAADMLAKRQALKKIGALQ